MSRLPASVRTSTRRFLVTKTDTTLPDEPTPSVPTVVTRSPSWTLSIGFVPPGTWIAVPAGKQPG